MIVLKRSWMVRNQLNSYMNWMRMRRGRWQRFVASSSKLYIDPSWWPITTHKPSWFRRYGEATKQGRSCSSTRRRRIRVRNISISITSPKAKLMSWSSWATCKSMMMVTSMWSNNYPSTPPSTHLTCRWVNTSTAHKMNTNEHPVIRLRAQAWSSIVKLMITISRTWIGIPRWSHNLHPSRRWMRPRS